MSNKFKNLDIQNRTYYFFNDFINIENFDLNNFERTEQYTKKILIYYDGYITIKDFKYV